MKEELLFIAIGAAAGLISGMGIGGGTILIPALLFFTSLSQQQAQGVNLIFFLPTAAIALWQHRKNKALVPNVAKPAALGGIAAAAAGAWLAVSLEGIWLRRIFGIFLMLMGVRELWQMKRKRKALPKESEKGEMG